MMIRNTVVVLVLIVAGCGGAGNSEPVGLYQGRWRGNWQAGIETGVLELRVGRTGDVTGSFQRSVATLPANLSGSMKKNGDLDASYDSTGGFEGTLAGNLQLSGSINRLQGSLTQTENDEKTVIDADLTRR